MSNSLAGNALRVSMWDLSAAISASTDVAYGDLDKRLDEALERGYDTIRIDAFPLLKYPPTGAPWEVITLPAPEPLQMTLPWTARGGFSAKPHANTLALLGKIRDRGMRAILTTWTLQFPLPADGAAGFYRRLLALEPVGRIHALVNAWKRLLADFAEADLLDTVAYIELHNEANLPIPALVANTDGASIADKFRLVTGEAVQTIKEAFPDLLVGCSFTMDWETVCEMAPENLDVLGYHPWVGLSPEVRNLLAGRNLDEYRDPGYTPPHLPPQLPQFLLGFHGIDQAKMNEFYRNMTKTCWESIQYHHHEALTAIKRRADAIGAHAALTEGYSVPWIYHGVAWDWIQQICEYCVRLAADLGYYAVTTCNFSSPLFELWDDPAWHKRMNRFLGACDDSR